MPKQIVRNIQKEADNMIGNIEWLISGSCRLTVSGGSDGNGKRIRYRKTIQVTGSTQQAKQRKAEKELLSFISECERGFVNDMSKYKLRDFANYWLEEYVEKKLAPKTHQSYKNEIEHRIIPALGNIDLKDLKPIHLVKFYNSLDTAPQLSKSKKKKESNDENGSNEKEEPKSIKYLSQRSKQNIHRILSSMLNDAVKWQIIPDNPATKVDPPKNPKKQAKYYDEKQIENLIAALENVKELKWKVFTYIAMFTGMRTGEIMGLEWSDINFENNTIKVDRISQYVNKETGVIEKTTKTETSIRTIVAPQLLIDLIKIYRTDWASRKLECGENWLSKTRLEPGNENAETDRLFIQWNGERMHPHSFGKWFSKFLTANNLDKINPHGLRHTFATLLINKGLNIKAISGMLGHRDTTTTLNIYSHVLKSVYKDAADKLDMMFTKNDDDAKKSV